MYYQQLPLYLKLISLLKLLYRINHQLPKEYKYSLGTEIINRNWELVDLFVLAQAAGVGGDEKRKIVGKISTSFDLFKLRLRFFYELDLISLGQVAVINASLEEIGKMIGSWKSKI